MKTKRPGFDSGQEQTFLLLSRPILLSGPTSCL